MQNGTINCNNGIILRLNTLYQASVFYIDVLIVSLTKSDATSYFPFVDEKAEAPRVNSHRHDQASAFSHHTDGDPHDWSNVGYGG